jgi:cardiolipin synthase A/B
MGTLWKQIRRWPVDRMLRHVTPLGLVRRALLGVFGAQILTVLVLMGISAIRNRGSKTKTFPHMKFEEVQVGSNRLLIYDYGRDLFNDMLAAIDEAQECIYIESYIWKDDEVGWEFKMHLEEKAAEGIAVYVIFDAFANLVVPRSFKASFAAPIHLIQYQAFRGLRQMLDPRHYSLDHRKVMVVDGKVGFIGGYNIGTPYANEWRDTHLRISGPAAADLASSFVDIWNRSCRKGNAIARRYQRHFDPLINLRGNDAQRLTFPIRDMYIDAIDKAQQAILLTNAYFVPDHVLLVALKNAAKRGVDVRVLVPWVSNHIVTDWVSHAYFKECLEGGVRIFSYHHTMLHAKTCTIDDKWSTIGTANLDRLSSVGNFEINVEIYSSQLARQMRELFECDTDDTFELTLEEWNHRPLYVKISETILTPLRIIM